VFGIGSYQMSVKFPTSTTSTGTVSTTTPTSTSLAMAQMLTSTQAVANSRGFTYFSSGGIATAGQGNFYQVTAPTLPVAGPELLTVTAASTDSLGLNPYITIFDASNNPLSYSVIDNGNGTFTAQLYGASAGSVYYIEVSALSGAIQNVGKYSLAVQLNNDAATTFAQLGNGTLTQTTTTTSTTLSMAASALVEFALSATTAGATAPAAVQMTICDQNNNRIFAVTAIAGQPLSTGFVLLSAGSYKVSFSALTATGTALPSISWTLAGRVLSDAQDPIPIDPTSTGTGSTGTGSGSTGTIIGSGSLPVIGPISSPTTTASTSP